MLVYLTHYSSLIAIKPTDTAINTAGKSGGEAQIDRALSTEAMLINDLIMEQCVDVNRFM